MKYSLDITYTDVMPQTTRDILRAQQNNLANSSDENIEGVLKFIKTYNDSLSTEICKEAEAVAKKAYGARKSLITNIVVFIFSIAAIAMLLTTLGGQLGALVGFAGGMGLASSVFNGIESAINQELYKKHADYLTNVQMSILKINER